MRYLVHLLPTTTERAALDQLRSRIAAQIGHNAALRYPTAHITLIYEIQDRPEHDSVIEPEVLKRILHTFDGRGTVLLEGGSFRPEGAHILRRFDDPPNLRTLREDLYARIRDSGAGPNGELQVWAQAIRAQTVLHLTLAQHIDRDRQGRAMEIVRREGRWIDEPIRGGELALLAWIREGGPDYEIIHRVTL